MSDSIHEGIAGRAERRRRALAAFNRWEAKHPARQQTPEQVIAALGTLYDLLPAESRRRDVDAQCAAVRNMHRALRHLRERS
jgi:hypothetical protein